MPKLNDSQLVILSAAANRDGGAVLPLPKSFKGGKDAAAIVIKTLLTKKLLREQPAEAGQAVWREGKDEARFALFITGAGLKALGIDEPAKSEVSAPKSKKGKPSKPRKRPSKIDAVITLLRRPEGANLQELIKATGWQAHSIRGAISGALKKRMGLAIKTEKTDSRGLVYRAA